MAAKHPDVLAELAHLIMEKRQERGISQTELARRIHTRQQVISNIETLRHANLTLGTLQKIARALDAKLRISLIPKP